jgi:hypothetical protein
MMLLALCCYAHDNHIFINKIDGTAYWYHYDGLVLMWMLGTLSIELQEIVHEPTDMHGLLSCQHECLVPSPSNYRRSSANPQRHGWFAIEAQFLDNRESHPSETNGFKLLGRVVLASTTSSTILKGP